MPDSQQTLRQGRCGHCGQIFFVCRHCDRGQVYCSADCRRQARRQSCRRANARHQASPEGRLDHRDRQRAYRMRRRARLTSVTDQGSQTTTAAFILPAPAPEATVVVVCAAAGRSADRGESVSVGATSQGSRHPDPGAARSRRDPPSGPGPSLADAPPSSADAAGGPGALASAAPARCAFCGQRSDFILLGAERRLWSRTPHPALPGGGRRARRRLSGQTTRSA